MAYNSLEGEKKKLIVCVIILAKNFPELMTSNNRFESITNPMQNIPKKTTSRHNMVNC